MLLQYICARFNTSNSIELLCCESATEPGQKTDLLKASNELRSQRCIELIEQKGQGTSTYYMAISIINAEVDLQCKL
jgi:hypothetical protein